MRTPPVAWGPGSHEGDSAGYNAGVTEPSIDRLTPTLRPSGRAVMYQRWRTLLFLHWTFPPEVVAPLLPPGRGKKSVGNPPGPCRRMTTAGPLP